MIMMNYKNLLLLTYPFAVNCTVNFEHCTHKYDEYYIALRKYRRGVE